MTTEHRGSERMVMRGRLAMDMDPRSCAADGCHELSEHRVGGFRWCRRHVATARVLAQRIMDEQKLGVTRYV